jgi:hypothetical protein
MQSIKLDVAKVKYLHSYLHIGKEHSMLHVGVELKGRVLFSFHNNLIYLLFKVMNIIHFFN